MKKIKIAASLLSADCARLGEEVEAVINAGADMIHLDVMDNHYVPNLTFGPLICKAIKKYCSSTPIDVHLMTKPVDRLITDFASAGANYITIHPEATEHIDRSLNLIRENGCKAGLVFNPTTPLDYLDYAWNKLDIILLMTVNPGFGGQKFIPSAIAKIKKTRELIKANNKKHILLEVDGGINAENIVEIAKAGADTFVMGSTIFNSGKNYKETIAHINNLLNIPPA